jgi:hypothetical protein
MDPVTLIVAALAAGAAVGLKDISANAIKDAYVGLKGLLRRKFAGRPAAEMVLDQHEQEPDVYRAPLKSELSKTGAGQDPQVIEAARRLLELADPEGTARGKYEVRADIIQGAQFGDHNQQKNVFGATPGISDSPPRD